MEKDAQIREKEQRRTALQEEAARIVAAASAQGRALTADEDSHALKLLSQVRALEEEIHHLAKHSEESRRHEKE